jgi:hypothetical protein
VVIQTRLTFEAAVLYQKGREINTRFIDAFLSSFDMGLIGEYSNTLLEGILSVPAHKHDDSVRCLLIGAEQS